MKKLSLHLSALLTAGAALFLVPVPHAVALEMRSWLKIDGNIFEAELVRRLGDDIELRDKNGKIIKLARTQLSFGDLDYVEENAPADKSATVLGAAKPKLPNPAKEVKIDTKLFKKEAGDFKINSRTYRVCETPHFKVMYMKPADPMGAAELAERLWIDTAFFHSTFIPKWHERKLAIVLVNDDEAYEDVGSWYADMIGAAGQKDEAEKLRLKWPESASGTVQMPQQQADERKIFSHIRVFRNYQTMVTKDTNGNEISRKQEPVKGVWVPFRTNTLAADMLDLHAGGIKSATSQGEFAIFRGHAYYKEILLNGRSETSMLTVKGSDKTVGRAGGFKTAKDWADDLRKELKKADPKWKPNLQELMLVKTDGADTKDVVFAYAFGRFLQSTPDRLTAFNKLCQKIDVANQVPDLEEIAKIYGYENAAALEKAWSAWMLSTDFK